MIDIEESSKAFRRDGYLVLKNQVPQEKVERLFRICENVYAQWKRESFDGSEPWGHHYKPSAWSILHINNPRYYREQPADLAFALDALAEPTVVALLDTILQARATFLQANYYIDPPSEPMAGGWHRDCQFFSPDEEVVKQMLIEEADPPRELHMHIPLVPTRATGVVEGSHSRWDTDEEYKVRRDNPTSIDMPGSKWLQLEPGDLAFFHVNAIHRGSYPVGVPRRTIAVTLGSDKRPRLATAEYMRNFVGYVATYQPWFLNRHYLDGVAPTTREFFQRFIDAYEGTWKGEFLLPEIGEHRIAYYTDVCDFDLAGRV